MNDLPAEAARSEVRDTCPKRGIKFIKRSILEGQKMRRIAA